MTTLPDLLYVALFAVAFPLWDYLVFWPAFHRRSQADPALARTRLWQIAIGSAWAIVAVGAALWVADDRSWTSFGFSVPSGWRLWTSIALFLLLAAYHVYVVATPRPQFRGKGEPAAAGRDADRRRAAPADRPVLVRWGFADSGVLRGVSVSRLLVWVFSPWLGWWGAAALSLPFFAMGHLYQGWNGVLRTGVVGAFYTLVVAISGSLWPAIALHALMDVGAGMMAWLALREESAKGDAVGLP